MELPFPQRLVQVLSPPTMNSSDFSAPTRPWRILFVLFATFRARLDAVLIALLLTIAQLLRLELPTQDFFRP